MRSKRATLIVLAESKGESEPADVPEGSRLVRTTMRIVPAGTQVPPPHYRHVRMPTFNIPVQAIVAMEAKMFSCHKVLVPILECFPHLLIPRVVSAAAIQMQACQQEVCMYLRRWPACVGVLLVPAANANQVHGLYLGI